MTSAFFYPIHKRFSDWNRIIYREDVPEKAIDRGDPDHPGLPQR